MEIVLAALVAAVVAGAVVLGTQRTRGSAAGAAPTASEPSDQSSYDRPSRQPEATGVATRDGDGAAVPPAEDRAGAPENRSAPPPEDGAALPATATGAPPVGDRGRSKQTAAVAPDPERDVPPPAPTAAGSAGSLELELRERRAEVARLEERLLARERSIDGREGDLARRQQSLEDRRRNLEHEAQALRGAKREHLRELERIASLTAGQAKQVLLQEVESDLRHERARLIRQAEEEARHTADRRARSILATAMQRVASGHAAETTVTVVSLSSDELKGRVIGREGRNIRTLETLTGVDFIIDDTPGVVVLSGFDGVRREIARLTLEKLLADGRIHPGRIEEVHRQARSEIENRIVEVGEQAVFEAGIGSLHPELVKLLGRLHFRTSYGQNVLAHSIECAHLGAAIADELGVSSKTARRAALLHDIGKAVSHEVEGPHALVGGRLARRHKESEAVAHAMEAHHNEVDVQTVEAVIVQIADALSGARPGARGGSLEEYTKRLRGLEEIAGRHAGVDRVYAIQAGREVRVVVRPEEVDDDTAAILSHEIAREMERELEYAGQIKVTVIRESRAVDYAK